MWHSYFYYQLNAKLCIDKYKLYIYFVNIVDRSWKNNKLLQYFKVYMYVYLFLSHVLFWIDVHVIYSTSGNVSEILFLTCQIYYRHDRLKPRASKFRGTPAKMYNTFDTVIGLSYLCCHNTLYSLNNFTLL